MRPRCDALRRALNLCDALFSISYPSFVHKQAPDENHCGTFYKIPGHYLQISQDCES